MSSPHQKGKRRTLTKTVPNTLDWDSGKCDSSLSHIEKGFHDGNVSGPFSFARFPSFEVSFSVGLQPD
jgi:hypothetical protein